MANPFLKRLKNLFTSQKILGDDTGLKSLVKANSLLQGLVHENRIPGLAITVLKDGKPILQKGYGYANLENKQAVDPRTSIFRIASVSKPLAATALAHMVAEDTIDLDASFYTYVPNFPKKQWDFTIRQLASHTAGIRKYKGKEFASDQPFSIKDSLVLFQNDDLLFEPGTGYEYSSFDWVLLSLTMQEASGIPFEDYVYQKVLKPLGMVHTVTPEQLPSKNTLVKNSLQNGITAFKYARWYTKCRSGFREAIPVNNFYKLAGGGYLSTSEDIAKLGQAYLEGYPLEENVVKQFLTSIKVNGKPTYYGLGWQVSQDKRGRTFYGHIGSSVGAYSNFFVYPEERLVFSILINCTDPKVQDVLDEVVSSLLEVYSIQ